MNKKLFMLGVVFAFMMTISGIFAITSSTNGGFTTSKVDIEIKEFTINSDNEEVLYSLENNHIALGEEISLIPKIYNLGADAYIRAKLVLEDSSTDISSWITGISSDWEKVGDYYYYNSKVEKNEYVEFFESIKFPESDEENENNIELKVQVIAEAIQSKNFEPDFTQENPWKGVAIEKMVNTSYPVDENNQSTIEVKFENGTDKYITISDNFFETIGGLLPGDSITETVKIKNSSKKTAEYFVGMMNENLTDSEKKIYVKIKNEAGSVIYNSSLYDFEKYSLGNLKKNEEREFEFEICLSENLDNSYVGIKVEPVWVFSAEFENVDDNTNNNPNNNSNTDTNGNPNNNSNSNTNSNLNTTNNTISNQTTTNTKDEIKENDENTSKPITTSQDENTKKDSNASNPKTGDRIDLSLLLFFGSAIGLITVIILSYKEKRKFK